MTTTARTNGLLIAFLLFGSPLSAAEYLVTAVQSGTVYRPPDGPALLAAMTVAHPCDRIILTAGQSYNAGELITPLRPEGACPITVETSGALPAGRLQLTADGKDLDPAVKAQMATIVITANAPALQIRTPGWVFRGIVFVSPTPNDTVVIDGGHRSTLDRVYMRGPATGGKRGIHVKADDVTITRSLVLDYKSVADAQAVLQLEGCGLTVLDNHLEATGENILLGGGDPRAEHLSPCKALIEGNTLFKRPEWEHEAWTVKNHIEVKDGKGVIVRGNRMVNGWNRAQRFSIVLTPVNQDGTAPYAQVRDVLIEHNETVNIYGCFQIGGWGYTNPTRQTSNIVIRNLRCDTRGGELFQISQEVLDLTLDHVTSTSTGSALGWMGQLLAEGTVKAADGSNRVPQYAVGTLTVRNSLWACDGGGIRSTQGHGTLALAAFVKNPVIWEKNVLGGCTAGHQYPAGTFLPTLSTFQAQLQADGTLVAGSVYKSAGSDGKDIGYLGVPGVPTPPPPVPVPPPTNAEIVQDVIDELTPLDATLTGSARTNLRNILTRLRTLLSQVTR